MTEQATVTAHVRPVDDTTDLRRVADLLGGERVLRHELKSRLDAHQLILQGIPFRALSQLVDRLIVIEPEVSLEKGIGMSLRTYQRRQETRTQPLNVEQSGRTWKFAEILAR